MPMYKENSSVPAQLREWADTATMNMFRDTKLNGGTTLDLFNGRVPAHTSGYFVGKATSYRGDAIESIVIPEADFTLATLRRAVGFLYAEHLTREELEASKPLEGAYVGTWADGGMVYLDAVNWTADYTQAVQWGLERGELAIYDVAANGSIDLEPMRLAVAV